MRSRFRPVSAGLALLIRPVLAAQPSLPQDGRNDTPPTLDAITVSATPLGLAGDTMALPVETLDGASLVLKRAATLGDTLNGTLDRQSVVSGKSVSVRVDFGRRHNIKNKNNKETTHETKTNKT